MATVDELLAQAEELYKENNYQGVIDLLPEKVLEEHKSDGLYVVKAGAYCDLREFDLCKGAAEKALAIEPNNANAYFIIGTVYGTKGQYKKAVNEYEKAIACDRTISSFHYYLGLSYYHLKQYKKAVDSFKEAIKIAPKYSQAFNDMGNVFKNLQEYENAIETYDKAIEHDPKFPYPYFNKASTFFILQQYENALIVFKKYIELTTNNPDYFTSLAKEYIGEIEKLINIRGYKNIKHLVDGIMDLLRYTENCVTHYTTMTVAKALVLDKDSEFRLSEAAYLNDTSEGKELFNFLSDLIALQDEQYKIKEKFIKKPFIGSFVANEKENDLTLWRMYGKEDREEAKGCSITMGREEFINSLMESLKKNKKEDALRGNGEFAFYRVAYRKKDKIKPFTIPSGEPGDEEKLNTLMTNLAEAVKTFVDEHNNNDDNMQTLLEKLNEIAYLFKTYDYQYEHEIRLVLNGTGFPKTVDSKFTPPKVYIELINIMPVITTITLGPKVERAEEWITAFHYGLKNEGYSADITKSELPFK